MFDSSEVDVQDVDVGYAVVLDGNQSCGRQTVAANYEFHSFHRRLFFFGLGRQINVRYFCLAANSRRGSLACLKKRDFIFWNYVGMFELGMEEDLLRGDKDFNYYCGGNKRRRWVVKEFSEYRIT